MHDLIERQTAIDAVNTIFAVTPTQKDVVMDCIEAIVAVPPTQPEWLNELKHLKSEKEKMIDTLSEKMADIGMCPNERDIILRIVGGTTNCEVHCNTDCNHTGCKSYHYATKELPSVKPERKKGKWIFKERREPVYDISGVKTWGIAYMCSECGFIHTVIEDFGQYAYCPNSNCGAEMEGQKDA